jgi:hypothetical protein
LIKVDLHAFSVLEVLEMIDIQHDQRSIARFSFARQHRLLSRPGQKGSA